jgi:hypothetical protein
VPIRQWVFTVPVRYQLAFDAALTRSVLRVFLRTVFSWQRRRAARRGPVGGRSGSITAATDAHCRRITMRRRCGRGTIPNPWRHWRALETVESNNCQASIGTITVGP